MTKGETMIYNRLHRKLKIEQHEPHQISWGELMCSGQIISYCSTSGTRKIYFLGLLRSNATFNIISAMHGFLFLVEETKYPYKINNISEVTETLYHIRLFQIQIVRTHNLHR